MNTYTYLVAPHQRGIPSLMMEQRRTVAVSGTLEERDCSGYSLVLLWRDMGIATLGPEDAVYD